MWPVCHLHLWNIVGGGLRWVVVEPVTGCVVSGDQSHVTYNRSYFCRLVRNVLAALPFRYDSGLLSGICGHFPWRTGDSPALAEHVLLKTSVRRTHQISPAVVITQTDYFFFCNILWLYWISRHSSFYLTVCIHRHFTFYQLFLF